MIKINLQNSLAGDGTGFHEEEVASDSSLKVILLIIGKLVFLIIFILGLYIYEQNELSLLEKILKKEKSLEGRLKNDISKQANIIKELKNTKSKYIDLKDKIFMTQEIAQSRLSFFKAIQALNAFRGEKLWFEKIDYNKKVLSIRGYAISKKILDKFIKNIRDRAHIFKNNILTEKKTFKDVVLRESKPNKVKKVNVRFFHLEIRL